MSRALQTLVGLASVAQPTAVTATQTNSNQNTTAVSELIGSENANNFVTTTIVGANQYPSYNPFAAIGLNSVFDLKTNQTHFFIDYKIRTAVNFNLLDGNKNAWRESKVVIKAPLVEGVSQLTSVSPLGGEELSPARMENINDWIADGTTFTQIYPPIDAIHTSYDLEHGEYTFRYANPHVGAFAPGVNITNEIAGITPYNPDNVFAITFSDTFWSFNSNGQTALKYETTFYYNPSLNTLYSGDGYDSPITNWINKVIEPETVPIQ